ncbi:hypothetical protein HDU96_002905 [Phlyctochytrium bullatum]|nr:hypothetical protein HDU96_002905 [Phlyctochytrium bullatum]
MLAAAAVSTDPPPPTTPSTADPQATEPSPADPTPPPPPSVTDHMSSPNPRASTSPAAAGGDEPPSPSAHRAAAVAANAHRTSKFIPIVRPVYAENRKSLYGLGGPGGSLSSVLPAKPPTINTAVGGGEGVESPMTAGESTETGLQQSVASPTRLGSMVSLLRKNSASRRRNQQQQMQQQEGGKYEAPKDYKPERKRSEGNAVVAAMSSLSFSRS